MADLFMSVSTHSSMSGEADMDTDEDRTDSQLTQVRSQDMEVDEESVSGQGSETSKETSSAPSGSTIVGSDEEYFPEEERKRNRKPKPKALRSDKEDESILSGSWTDKTPPELCLEALRCYKKGIITRCSCSYRT